MLRYLNPDIFYDPVYRDSIYRMPAGRGLYFAPEAVKRITNILETTLNSSGLQRLHFVREDPFLSFGYPSLNFSAFSQLIGTLFLSDLCRAKVSVEGVMLFQWLLENNILEEFIIGLLLERMVRFPFDRVVMGEEPFCSINKADIIVDLITGEGIYSETWVDKYPGVTNAFKEILDKLGDTLDHNKLIKVIRNESSLEFKYKVLQSFFSGDLRLSRTDRTIRLAYGSGRDFDNLNVDALYQDVEILNDNGTIKYSIPGNETKEQLLRFYLTYHGLLVPEVLSHQDVCLARGLFRNSFRRFIKTQKEKGFADTRIVSDLLFLNDMELWHEILTSGVTEINKIQNGIKCSDCCTKSLKCTKEKAEDLASESVANVCSNLKLDEADVIVDIVTPRPTDNIWHLPNTFDSERHTTEKKLRNIDIQRTRCRLVFCVLKNVNQGKLQRSIDEVVGKYL